MGVCGSRVGALLAARNRNIFAIGSKRRRVLNKAILKKGTEALEILTSGIDTI